MSFKHTKILIPFFEFCLIIALLPSLAWCALIFVKNPMLYKLIMDDDSVVFALSFFGLFCILKFAFIFILAKQNPNEALLHNFISGLITMILSSIFALFGLCFGFDIYLLGGLFYAQNITQASTIIGSILLILAAISAIFSLYYNLNLYKILSKITNSKLFMLSFSFLALGIFALFFFFGSIFVVISSILELFAFKNLELKNKAIYNV